MNGSWRTWNQRIACGAAVVASLVFAGCGESEDEPSRTNRQTTVPNPNDTMNVTFYAFTDEDGGSREVVSTGTFDFDKSGLEQDQFYAQWRLDALASAKAEQLVEEDCLALLSGRGVLDASTTNEKWSLEGEWSLNLQPNLVDRNIVITLDSFKDDAWSGVWFFHTDAGITNMGAFEAKKAGG